MSTTTDKIYSHGWGKNILTSKRNNKPYVFNDTSWYNLSKWVYECEDFDGQFANLFHDDITIRWRAEMNLANVLVRASILTDEERRFEDADGMSAGYKSYNGPKIKRKKTLRITLREMVIIVHEHRTKVLAWKRPKETKYKTGLAAKKGRQDHYNWAVKKFGKDKKESIRLEMLEYDKENNLLKPHSAAEEPATEEPPAPAEPVVTEYDVDDWEELADIE
jgi:hypothetical protein